MKILVTGAAGFIGSHVSMSLLARGDDVVGIDNLNDYYDVTLKENRLFRIEAMLKGDLKSNDSYSGVDKKACGKFEFQKLSLEDKHGMEDLFAKHKFEKVVHLAAQAGVRYSIQNPAAYIDSNVVGFMHILEGCRHNNIEHLVYASTSSVYGANEKLPFSVHDNIDHPLSFYAATKKANELMAHSYSALYDLPTTGLRFFTVYGPWGRPDMALFLFTKNILADKPIQVFNFGKHTRDFTYIDDIVEGIIRTMDKTAKANPDWDGKNPDPGTSKYPWRVYNIGNSDPVELSTYIECIENALGKKAEKELLPLQPGDVPDTKADVEDLMRDVGYKPETTVDFGVARFIEWYRDYYQK